MDLLIELLYVIATIVIITVLSFRDNKPNIKYKIRRMRTKLDDFLIKRNFYAWIRLGLLYRKKEILYNNLLDTLAASEAEVRRLEKRLLLVEDTDGTEIDDVRPRPHWGR